MTSLKSRDGSLYPLRAVDRVCDVIEALAAHPDGVTLSVLSLLVQLPKSSAFRYLAALEMRGIVTRSDDDISYRLAPGAVGSGRSNAERLDRLLLAAKPLMHRMASSGSVICLLAALDGAYIRFLWVDGSGTPDRRTPMVGDQEQLHTTAVGKAIAGQLSDDGVLAALETTGMATPTPQSLSAPTALLRELHRVRGEGFALSAHERYPDVRAVAVPIGGETMALGIAGLTEVLTAERVSTSVRQLRRAAVVLARELRE
jgi:IclR family transcriptional regulator, acetate operon repressor